jgi:hypothetical protein
MKKLQNRLPHFVQKYDPKSEAFGSFTLHQVADRSLARISAAHPGVPATSCCFPDFAIEELSPSQEIAPSGTAAAVLLHSLRQTSQFSSISLRNPRRSGQTPGVFLCASMRRLRLIPSLSPSVGIDQTPDRFDASSSDGREMHREQATSRRHGWHGDDLRGDLPAILRAGSCQGAL